MQLLIRIYTVLCLTYWFLLNTPFRVNGLVQIQGWKGSFEFFCIERVTIHKDGRVHLSYSGLKGLRLVRGMFEMNCLFLSGDFKFQVSLKVLISCPQSTPRG